MPGIIVAPDLGKVLVQKQGVFQMHREDANLECNCPRRRGDGCGGISPSKLPMQFHKFELLCLDMGSTFIAQMRRRGYEWADGDLVVHGPFPSYDLVHTMQDADATSLAAAMRRSKDDGWEHPELALPFTQMREESEWVDYVCVGQFLFKDRMSDVEIP